MFRSLSAHHQGDTIFVLTSVTKIIDVAACLLQCVCWVLSCPVIVMPLYIMFKSTGVLNQQLFGRVHKRRKKIIIFVMPVGPSVRFARRGSYWTDFLGI